MGRVPTAVVALVAGGIVTWVLGLFSGPELSSATVRASAIFDSIIGGVILALLVAGWRKAREPLQTIRTLGGRLEALTGRLEDLERRLGEEVERAQRERAELRAAWNIDGDGVGQTPAEVWQAHVRDFDEHREDFTAFREAVVEWRDKHDRDARAVEHTLDAQSSALERLEDLAGRAMDEIGRLEGMLRDNRTPLSRETLWPWPLRLLVRAARRSVH